MKAAAHRYLRSLRLLLTSGKRPADLARQAQQILVKKLRTRRAAALVQAVHGPTFIPGGERDVIVVCPLRDGEEFLPHFLAHHRRLGVAHFVFIDNGSRDHTLEILRAQPDTTVYSSPLPYKHYQDIVRRMITWRHGRHRWILLADIDECFDYPHSDHVSLVELLEYLDARGFDAMVAHLLDRFCDEPVLQTKHPADGDLARAFRYYDNSALERRPYRSWFGPANVVPAATIPCFFGGVRTQFFGTGDPLTKHPLLKLRDTLGGPNNAHDISYAHVADITGVLSHYKFTAGFSRVLQRALEEGGYFNGSMFYRKIAAVLEENPGLSLLTPTAQTLESISQLVAEGFLTTSTAYEAFAAARRTPEISAPHWTHLSRRRHRDSHRTGE